MRIDTETTYYHLIAIANFATVTHGIITEPNLPKAGPILLIIDIEELTDSMNPYRSSHILPSHEYNK